MNLFPDSLFDITSEKAFDSMALRVFRFQFENQPTYRQFCILLKRTPDVVKTVEEIPFLPISFFKSHQIITENRKAEIVFGSSGTTQTAQSKHFVADLSIYKESFLRGFQNQYGNPTEFIFLALLPSYQERTDSSLVFMVDELIKQSNHPESGYFLDRNDELARKLNQLDGQGKKVMLIGVSYALLDLLDTHQFCLQNTIVMETGGMKGRRKELVRDELHLILSKGFGVSQIHSEYGMTELLSQAYSTGSGVFTCQRWTRVSVRDVNDSLSIIGENRSGGINVIDLANVYSCSFIATQDLGKRHANGSFEILGRFDNSDIRGCNLLVQ